jgi:hypothetical protein
MIGRDETIEGPHMSGIDHSTARQWSDYHMTRRLDVADVYAFRSEVAPHPDGPTRLAETAATLKEHVATLSGPAAVGVLGAGWSMNDIIGSSDRLLYTSELTGVSWVEAHHLHHQSRLKPREAVFVAGGTTWQALVDQIENDPRDGRSILTCGSYLQQSIAGSVATSTAGSRIGVGGVQNQVLGIHLVTNEGSAWIERGSDPVIGHVAVDFADRVIRDDRLFEDALVHLGGMGIVNGMVIETTPRDLFTVTRVTMTVHSDWLEWVRDGDFARIANWLGQYDVPVYYEVQVDPFALFASPALHTMYFPARNASTKSAALAPAPAMRVNDALASLGAIIASGGRHDATSKASRCPDADCGDPTAALADVFRYYSCCYFEDVPASGPQTWGQIHGHPPAQDRQGVVFSAAFAVDRAHIDRSLPTICDAARGRPRQFLYTLRFVSGAAGTMAFQTFEDTIVIDFEGLKATPDMEHESSISLGMAHDALTRAGLQFRGHWGKLGSPDAAKVAADFGSAAVGGSPASRWIQARDQLVPAASRPLFRNDALIRWDLA